MSALNSNAVPKRKKAVDATDTVQEKISRAPKRRKITNKNNNNSTHAENDSDEQLPKVQDTVAKRTRRSLRNIQIDHYDAEMKDLFGSEIVNENKSAATEKASTVVRERAMNIKNNLLPIDGIRSRGLYKLKMASCKRLELSFCMTQHRHNVFAMDAAVNNALFAAGGSGGNLSLFQLGLGLYSNSDLEAAVLDRKTVAKVLPPFLTLNVHDAWISGVKFLNIDREDENYSLLTTSDDAKLKLWNFDTALQDEYQTLAHMNPVSEVTTESGIYSLDAINHSVLTSCKSGEVVLHQLTESKLRTVQHYIAHTDVAKHVRWRDQNVFATCGNDKKVNVYDIRVAQTQPKVISYENAHPLSINTVAWQPGEPFRLISSGFDQAINIWDLKRPSKPLFSITGYQGKSGRSSAIFHPIFVFAGAAILTAADSSRELYMFDTVNGKLTKNFDLGYTANGIYSDKSTEYIVATQNQRLNVLLPKAKRSSAVVKNRSKANVTNDEEKQK